MWSLQICMRNGHHGKEVTSRDTRIVEHSFFNQVAGFYLLAIIFCSKLPNCACAATDKEAEI